MLTVKACVRYEGDWTKELSRYDVSGEFLASTFRNRQYIGIVTIETKEFENVIETIENHHTVVSVEIIEEHETKQRGKLATLFIEGKLSEFSPLQTLMYEGFLPIGPTALRNGQECFDLLVKDRNELSNAVELLREFGSVNVVKISEGFQRRVTPSSAEWQELLSSIPPRQRQLLNKALEQGYFEIPRQVTLEELADEMGVNKTTASNHLRKVEQKLMEVLIPYINLAVDENRG